jgi:methionyl aminopeptidase
MLNVILEHTLLVTKDGVEVLTARFPDSPGGPVEMPSKTDPAATAGPVANGS